MSNKKDHTTLWPQWVGKDCDCSVWVLGYDAALSGWAAGAMPLVRQGTSVLDRLASEPRLQGQSLVLVGHSLGGLVIKSAVVNGMTHGVPRYEALLRQVRGVVFVATPHSGSQIANVATALSPIRWLLRINSQVSDLRGSNVHLSQLNHQFRAQQSILGFSVRTFLETQEVCFPRWFRLIPRLPIVMVVPAESAEPHVSGEVAIPLAADHFSIAKPLNRSAQIHTSLLEFLSGIKKPSAIKVTNDLHATGPANVAASLPVTDNPLTGNLSKPPRSTELAMGEIGLHPRGKAFVVTALVVTDDASSLIQEVSQWRERLARDPLIPAQLKQTVHEMDLRSLFAQPTVGLQLMSRLAVTPFSAYVYYAPAEALDGFTRDEILNRFYIEPLVHRMSKKAENIDQAWAEKSDFQTLLERASALVRNRYARSVAVPTASLAPRRQGAHLIELAHLVAFAVQQYLMEKPTCGDTALFEHLRTRVRFAQNVVSGEKHKRDENPL